MFAADRGEETVTHTLTMEYPPSIRRLAASGLILLSPGLVCEDIDRLGRVGSGAGALTAVWARTWNFSGRVREGNLIPPPRWRRNNGRMPPAGPDGHGAVRAGWPHRLDTPGPDGPERTARRTMRPPPPRSRPGWPGPNRAAGGMPAAAVLDRGAGLALPRRSSWVSTKRWPVRRPGPGRGISPGRVREGLGLPGRRLGGLLRFWRSVVRSRTC